MKRILLLLLLSANLILPIHPVAAARNFILANVAIMAGLKAHDYFFDEPREMRWDWNKINNDEIMETLLTKKLPTMCVADSEYQISGAQHLPNSQWARFENTTLPNGKSPILNGDKTGPACDHWNRYKEDIKLVKDLGVKMYRFSLEWSRIQPQEGVFDQDAINHYHDKIDECWRQGLTPMVTLHHFSNPIWFEDKGEFQKIENFGYFVEFCKKMFAEFGSKVHLWCTINEPGVYAFSRCPLRNKFPSALSFQETGELIKNLMKAHAEVYANLKEMPHGDKAHIGLVHQMIQFDPYHPQNPVEKGIAYTYEHTVSDAITQFLITGDFEFYLPGLAYVRYRPNFDFRSTLDFIGLNYYSHAQPSWSDPLYKIVTGDFANLAKPAYRPEEIETDMPYGIYAEGLYRAIETISKIGVPIYITENGIADAKDDRRELFIKRYLYAVAKAIEAGYDIRSYCYWSLMDNFEWNDGYTMKFGLHEVDFKTQERRLRKGSEVFKQVAWAQQNREENTIAHPAF